MVEVILRPQTYRGPCPCHVEPKRKHFGVNLPPSFRLVTFPPFSLFLATSPPPPKNVHIVDLKPKRDVVAVVNFSQLVVKY